MPILHRLLQKIEEEVFPNLLYKTSFILIQKPDKDILRKLQTKIDTKILDKLLANQFQQYKNNII